MLGFRECCRGGMCTIILLIMQLTGCDNTPESIDRSVAIMSSEADSGFAPVVPDRLFHFPADHLPHPKFRTEWWYLTANLKSENGEMFGVQWTLFRSASSIEQGDGWQSPQRYMAHIVVTSKDKMWAAERFARGGIGQAGVIGKPYRAWLDNWSWRSFGDSPFPGTLTFADDGMRAKLAIQNTGSLILQGEGGFSQKHPTQDIASYYYSAPFLALRGQLELDGKTYQVSGEGWYDREWSSAGLSENQLGWDWFSIRLDDGRALMLYQIREKDQQPYILGSLSQSDGTKTNLTAADIHLSPVSFTAHEGKNYPLDWIVDIPSQQIKLRVNVVRKAQWLPFVFSYWEGPITVSGSHSGQGFMELTGY
ncbi:lipocalin-like domain-containing protein [Photobacterium nomapromontoriensis]|uniref:lipocalin-like domain-containing protein n=1 Tax=Photobacterium nomapromontoriensis TaxID=2910237 RepID=UPI003D0DA416